MTTKARKSHRPAPNFRLLLALRRRRIKSYQLAQIVGVDPAHISLLLNGRRRGSPEVRQRIAEVLGEQQAKLFDDAGQNW